MTPNREAILAHGDFLERSIRVHPGSVWPGYHGGPRTGLFAELVLRAICLILVGLWHPDHNREVDRAMFLVQNA